MRNKTFQKYVKEFCEDLAVNNNNKHAYKRCQHSCVLTYNNVIISSATNVNLKNDFTKSYNDLKALHAEPLAIMRAMKHHSRIIHKCDLWVCRQNINIKTSKPCPMCQKIIKSFGIKNIHYTDDVGNWISEVI